MRPGACLALLLALGCTRAADIRADLRRDPRRGAHIDDVPFVAQQPDTCGAAALASVLLHAGLPASEPALATALRTRQAHGALTYELVVEARRQGALAAQRYDVTAEDLRRALDAGVAPIVLRGGLANALLGVFHYSVLTAYDRERAVWIGHDGEAADVLFTDADLEADRRRANRWALFVVGPAARPTGLPPGVHLELGVQAEQTAHPDAAAHHYAQAAWTPASAQALLNLANLALAADDLPRAELLLRAALTAEPGSAAARNNLAWTLLKQGRHLDEAANLAAAAAEDPDIRTSALDTLAQIRAAQGQPEGEP
ncbi:MAG: hypothetical protein R3F60_18130 [bacterium]